MDLGILGKITFDLNFLSALFGIVIISHILNVGHKLRKRLTCESGGG